MKTAQMIQNDLSALIKGDVRSDEFNRTAFSTDASIYRIVPTCVISPKDEADVAAAVKYAAKNKIPIAPRGAGSGLAGESLTAGIVLDMRRYMNNILETAPDGSWVRVQPGVVLDTLNTHLAKWARKIGPDPSSGNRAVIGGIVGNNATGSHSPQYGYISDFVRSMRAVTPDGSVCEFKQETLPDVQNPAGRYAQACYDLLKDKKDLIEKAQPATKRNRCGYNIHQVLNAGSVNMTKLLAGSEGTLAVFTEFILRTVPMPKALALLQFEFATIEQMAQAVPLIIKCGANTCELMDRSVMNLILDAHPSYKDIIPQDCEMALLVEHSGQTVDEVESKIIMTVESVGSLAKHYVKVIDKDKQARLWKSRKDAVPLLNRNKGELHAVGFIEDVSVDNRRLGDYIAKLQPIGKKHGVTFVFFGHAGDGEIHIRPYLDLGKYEDVKRMRGIAEDVFPLAWSLGGTISGEHACGLLRTAFIERQYGTEYANLLRSIKKIFDPAGILNPNKIICDDPDIMEKNLRAAALKTGDLKTQLHFEPKEFRLGIDQCSGCGVCQAETNIMRMCPVFRGTFEELGSSRAKANLLASWLAGQTAGVTFDPKEFKRILSLCINCQMCAVECPAGADISKLVIEARTQLAKETGFTIAETALSYNRFLSLLASCFAPLSNYIMALPITRWAMEKSLGLDKTRRFPLFQRGSFIKKAQRYISSQPSIPNPLDRVVYFVDSFANYNDHDLGFAVLHVLSKLGVQVVVPNQLPAPLPAYVYGNINAARKDMAYNIKHLEPWLTKGYRIVCSEPSAALFLKNELRFVIDSPSARKVSENTFELMDYIGQMLSSQNTKLNSLKESFTGKLAYHEPCHLKSLLQSNTSIEILMKAGLNVSDLKSSCCGLAGTAGMQVKNHDLANSIGLPLKQAIEGMQPDLILSECAACRMQIQHLTSRPVSHPIKLIAAALS